jgi:hypothetical protein
MEDIGRSFKKTSLWKKKTLKNKRIAIEIRQLNFEGTFLFESKKR